LQVSQQDPSRTRGDCRVCRVPGSVAAATRHGYAEGRKLPSAVWQRAGEEASGRGSWGSSGPAMLTNILLSLTGLPGDKCTGESLGDSRPSFSSSNTCERQGHQPAEPPLWSARSRESKNKNPSFLSCLKPLQLQRKEKLETKRIFYFTPLKMF